MDDDENYNVCVLGVVMCIRYWQFHELLGKFTQKHRPKIELRDIVSKKSRFVARLYEPNAAAAVATTHTHTRPRNKMKWNI